MLPGVDFFDVVTTTRAVRRYRDEPIAEDDLAKMFFAATRAPSGSNSQPFRFLVLRDGPRALEARALLGTSFRRLWESKKAADRYDEGSALDPASRKGRMAASMQHFVDHIDEAPAIVLVCAHLRHSGHFTEGASVYPACQNLLLAARALGYGGVMTMWHAAVEADLSSLLGLPDEVSIAATIPLGRPVGNHGPVRRRHLGELVHEDAWQEPAPWAIDPPNTPTHSPRS
jgi:nitroreductase